MKEALHLTTQTINDRLRWYRNLVIGFVGLSGVSIFLSITLKLWQPLLGFLFLIPLWGVFLSHDLHLVFKWQERILRMWIEGHLDLGIFYNSMKTIRMFPQRMYQSMLQTLPIPPILNYSLKKFDSNLRRIVASILQTLNQCQRDRTILVSLCYFFTFFFLVLAILLKSTIFLLGVFLGPLSLGFHFYLQTIRWRELKKYFLDIEKYKLEDSKDFIEALSQIDWRPISDKKRKQLFSQISLKESFR